MPKRLSENEKEEILKSFTEGLTIDKLAEKHKFTKLTISRNLKNSLGDLRYKELFNKNKTNEKTINIQKREVKHDKKEKFINEENFQEGEFFEIAPIDFDIDNAKRKELSSVPLKNVDLPDIVYMIVDKSIELEIKLLSEYPDWHFLPPEDLKRKTIEIFYDLKVAKRSCNKNQKVLKVPNSKVFEIASPILISRGITRIITEENLISL